MEKAKRAHRGGNDHEYQRLLARRNEIPVGTRPLCRRDDAVWSLSSLQGTGVRLAGRLKCHGSGGIITDMSMVSRRFGLEMRQAVELAVDEVIRQASRLVQDHGPTGEGDAGGLGGISYTLICCTVRRARMIRDGV